MITRNTSSAIVALPGCGLNPPQGCTWGHRSNDILISAFEVRTNATPTARGVWATAMNVDGGNQRGPIPLGGNNIISVVAPFDYSQRHPSATWAGFLAQPHVLSLGVPGHAAIVGICGGTDLVFSDVCLAFTLDGGASWGGTFFVNPADKAGPIRDVAATVSYYETNAPAIWGSGPGDHNVYASWQARDNHHYIARVLFNWTAGVGLSLGMNLISDMNLRDVDSDVNIVGMHAPPNCGTPVDQVLAVWPNVPTDPTKCTPGNPARDPGNPLGSTAQFWKTKFANVWTSQNTAVWSAVTPSRTDSFWPFCVGNDGRFANSARPSLAFIGEPNQPSSQWYTNDVLMAVTVSAIGDPGYPGSGWVPPQPYVGTIVQYASYGMSVPPSCGGPAWVPGPPPPPPPPYTNPGDSGIPGQRQDEFLPSLSTTLNFGNGGPPSNYSAGLTWIDSRIDPAQSNMPCNITGRTLDKYPLGIGVGWSADNTFFGPAQQLMAAGCFDEDWTENFGDRLGRYNESPYQVPDWNFPMATIISSMGMGFSNGQNFLSQPIPNNPGPPPGIFTQTYRQ